MKTRTRIKRIFLASLLSLIIVTLPQLSHALTLPEAFASPSKLWNILVDVFLVLYALALGFLIISKQKIKEISSDWIKDGEIIYYVIDALIYVAPSFLVLLILDVSPKIIILLIIAGITWLSYGIDYIKQNKVNKVKNATFLFMVCFLIFFISAITFLPAMLGIFIVPICMFFWYVIQMKNTVSKEYKNLQFRPLRFGNGVVKVSEPLIEKPIISGFVIIAIIIIFVFYFYATINVLFKQGEEINWFYFISVFITIASNLCYKLADYMIKNTNSSSSSSSRRRSSSSRSSSSSSSSSSYSNYDYGDYGGSSSSSSGGSDYGGGSSGGGGAGGDW